MRIFMKFYYLCKYTRFTRFYSNKMNIKTFVFLDSETTGLPAYENYKTRITELCLVSAQSEHVYLGVIPRVQNKLNICFNPLKRINPIAEKITGLYNDELDTQSSFNDVSLNLLRSFIERLSKPVCFVAHNGFQFDYPILRNHIEMVGNNFPDDILCIDTLCAFRELLRKPELKVSPQNQSKNSSTLEDDGWDEILAVEVQRIEAESVLKTPTKEANVVDPQKVNETTPPLKTSSSCPGAPSKILYKKSVHYEIKPIARRQLHFTSNGQSFKLGDIYERLLQKPQPSNAHHAEADVQMLLECALNLGELFVDWANKNAISFNQIPKMGNGKLINTSS